MKPRRYSILSARLPRLSALVVVSMIAARHANAASDSWDGSTSNAWATVTNWTLDTTAPGTGETATFNGAGNANTIIDLGAGVTVGSIAFDTASAAAYTIGSGAVGSQTLTLDLGTSTVAMSSSVVNNQLFNSNVLLGNGAAATYNISNASTTNNLTFAGTIQGGTGGTPGAQILNVSPAAGTGAGINITNAITSGGATSIALRNTAAGTLTLSGAVSSSLADLRGTTAGALVVVNGQTVTVANGSQYGGTGTGATGKFDLQSGSAAFNSGINTANTSSDGSMIRISGGTFSASAVNIGGRTSAIASATTAASSTSGFVFAGGTGNIAGNLGIRTQVTTGTNSSASGLVSGGDLIVGGEVQIGTSNAASSRWDLLQVSGGTLTVNDATNGIVVGRGSATTLTRGSLFLTGGTTTAEKISFGLNGGLDGSSGTITLNGASASLYLGSGGIVKAATGVYTEAINLTSGTLGAKADWATSLGITFSGTGTTLKAADASDVSKNITLSGVLAGTGGFTKSGAGKVILTNGGNTFSGTVNLTAGKLRIQDANALQNAVVTATGLDIEDGLEVATAITSPTIGGLTGSANFDLINESSAALALKLGNTSAGPYSGIITGSGSIEKIGSGTQQVTTAVFNHTGGTTLTAGTLQFNNSGDSSAVFGSGVLTMNGGRLRFNSTSASTFNGDLVTTANGGQISYRGNGTFNPASVSGTGILTLTADDTITVSSNDYKNFAGSLVVGTGTGTMFFRFVSPYVGNSLANAAVHLSAGVNQSRNYGTSFTQVTDIGTLSGDVGSTLGGSAPGGGQFVFSVGSRNENSTFAGTIVDGGTKTAFTKVGTGIQTLSGTNTYTGGTTVNGGTLALDATGSISNSATVTIGAAGTLNTSAQTTYTIPGAQPVVFGIDATGSGSSGKIAAAALDISSAVVTYNITGTPDDPVYILATYTSLSGTPSFASVDAPPAGYTLNYAYEGNKIALVQSGGAPEIAVEQPAATDISNGGSKDFGTVTIGSNASLTFTIRNSGTDALNLTGSPLVAVSGANAAEFTVTALPSTPVTSGGGTTTFTVEFAPTASGVRNAVLTITNNDSDEGTFTINVSGTGQTQYDAWSGGAAFNVDTNGDGVKNGMAFLLGASSPTSAVTLPTVTQSGGNLTLTFNCRNAASRGSATLSVEHSSNLGISDPWTAVAVPETSGGPTSGVTYTVTPGSPTNSVIATISSSEAASGKLFGRLRATEN